MAEGPRYHLRRGRMPRLVDQVPAHTRAYGTIDSIPRIATGSVCDLQPPSLDELGELQQPVVERLPTAFGAVDIVVEYHGDRVALVLPGSVRMLGTADEAAKLAALLVRKR
jgi:hypothetical protein